MYPAELVKPMREDLTKVGFEELQTAEAVNTAIATKKPDHITTVFAGVDREAVDAARAHMVPFPPSSPCMALFKDGELVHMLERHHIEGRPAELIAENLVDAYNTHC